MSAVSFGNTIRFAFAFAADGREQQRGENRDDSNDHKQLEHGESIFRFEVISHACLDTAKNCDPRNGKAMSSNVSIFSELQRRHS